MFACAILGASAFSRLCSRQWRGFLWAPSADHGPGLQVQNIPLKACSAVGMRNFWQLIPSGSQSGVDYKWNTVKIRYIPRMDFSMEPRENTPFRFSGGTAVLDSRPGSNRANALTCTIVPRKNYSTGARRLRRRSSAPSLVVANKAFDSDMSTEDSENFPSDPKAKEICEVEETVGNTELTSTPLLVDETAAKSSLRSGDPYSDSEKEKTEARFGELITAGYFALAFGSLLLVDCYLPRITQGTRAPYFLTKPFLVSAATSAICGYICVPLLRTIEAAQIFREEGPAAHLVKSGTPTMGGLFFIPAGLAVAAIFNRNAAFEVRGAIVLTLVYGGIGLLDDGLALMRKHNYGLPGRMKFVLQVVAGIVFFLWLKAANISSASITKSIVPMPAPIGHLHLGKWYMALTAFCCAAMSNGVNLTDGVDGLAGGTAAAAFIGMAVAVYPSCAALGRFGSSMAGACFGFLIHNRYKAKVFMGDTGSLALGGSLAAMAACTGMFFPLFIASGVFVIETLSVVGQVFYFKLTKRLYGQGRRLLRMAPFHHHLEFLGFSERRIAALAYALGTECLPRSWTQEAPISRLAFTSSDHGIATSSFSRHSIKLSGMEEVADKIGEEDIPKRRAQTEKRKLVEA
ncbi:hypothetical protein R1flu_017404 [Riccia fluitans]|uniref:Phospho-N-acetylmuramoyl-pentapeptide-transferase n=1 Tax=Riccia fluitans TaxID=41844 RepID=A0ABD1ZCV6_9MARC